MTADDLARLAWDQWRTILINPPAPVADPAAALAVYADRAAMDPPAMRRGTLRKRRVRAAVWAALVDSMEPSTGIIAANPRRLGAAARVHPRHAARVCSWARRHGLLASLGYAPSRRNLHVIVTPCQCRGHCEIHPWPYSPTDEPPWQTIRQDAADTATAGPAAAPPPGYRWARHRREANAIVQGLTEPRDPAEQLTRRTVLELLRWCMTTDGTIRAGAGSVARLASPGLTRTEVQSHVRALVRLGVLGRIPRGWETPWLAFIAPENGAGAARRRARAKRPSPSPAAQGKPPVLIEGQRWVLDRDEAAQIAPLLVAQLRPNRDPHQTTVQELEAVYDALREHMADDGIIRATSHEVADHASRRPGVEIAPRQVPAAVRALVRAGLIARVADVPGWVAIVAPATSGARLVCPPPKPSRNRARPTRRERRAAKAAAAAAHP